MLVVFLTPFFFFFFLATNEKNRLLLEPYRPPDGLSESLFLELLTLVAGYLAKRLELALKRRFFTQLGALQVQRNAKTFCFLSVFFSFFCLRLSYHFSNSRWSRGTDGTSTNHLTYSVLLQHYSQWPVFRVLQHSSGHFPPGMC